MPETSANQPNTFRVEIPDYEIDFQVGPDESIVEVARRHDIEILTACEDGQCGTCVVKVLEGEVEHRDRALAPEKRDEGWMCACVSRAKDERLVLEIW